LYHDDFVWEPGYSILKNGSLRVYHKFFSSKTNEQIAKLNLYEIDYEKVEKALPPYASAAYPRPLN